MADRLLWIDFETGGTDPEVHSPLSFAAVGYEDGKIIGEWETQIRFSPMVVEPEALAINKIDIRTPGLGLGEFRNQYWSRINTWFYGGHDEFTGRSPIRPNRDNMPYLAGQKVDFDRDILQKHIGDWVGAFTHICIDILPMSVLLKRWGLISPLDGKLGTVMSHLGITPEGELHTALTDLKGSIKVYEKYKEMICGGKRQELQASFESAFRQDGPVGGF